MALHINEAEVQDLLTIPMAIAAVEEISRKQAASTVIVHTRRRFELASGGFFHYMAALDTAAGLVAMKQYTYVKGKLCFLVPLYSTSTGELLALIEADHLSRLRTGAASGVASNYLARPDAQIAAVIGTGRQAETQLEALASVRKLTVARVFGRDRQRRKDFAEKMSRRIGVPVSAAESAADAVRGADIVSTATTSSHPVLDGQDLSPGVHVNAIGANHAHKQELDATAVARAGLLFVDSLAQSKQEAGDVIIPFAQTPERWAEVHELNELVAGKVPGRGSSEEITLFKSNGIASWDLAVAAKVYALAQQRHVGRELPLFRPV